MVKIAIKPNNRDRHDPNKLGLLSSAAVVSALTLLSRVLGLVRDGVLLHCFGSGGMMDAFLVAFRLPNFVRRLFAEGAFSQAFVPVLMDYQTAAERTGDLAPLRGLLQRVTGALLLILGIITAFGIWAAPWLVHGLAVGFIDSPAKFDAAVQLVRVMLPFGLLITLTALAGSVLQSYQRFVPPAFAPVVLNVMMIGAAWWVAPHTAQPLVAVAWSVTLAGVVQLVLQLPALRALGLLVLPLLDFAHTGVRRILRLLLPAVFAVSVLQINLLLNTLLASLMVDGSVAWLYAAERVSELPLGLIGVAIGTVILPVLARTASADTPTANFAQTLDWAVRLVVLIGLPATGALMVISNVLMVTLFAHGEFSLYDAQMAGLALKGMAAGLLGFMLIKVFAPAFFARQDSRTPVRVGMAAVAVNALACALLIALFHWLGIALHAALAFATSASALANAALLYTALHRRGVYRLTRTWRRFGWQLLAANTTMLLALLIGVAYFPLTGSHMTQILALAALCVGGALVYAVTLLAVGVRLTVLTPPLLAK